MYETKKGYTNHDTHISIAFNFAGYRTKSVAILVPKIGK